MEFNNQVALIHTIPEIECESPMIISFKVKINGDMMIVKFIGDKARALRNHFRNGDFVQISGFIKDGICLVENCILDPRTSVGRSLNMYA